MEPGFLLSRVLFLFGVGFLAANLKVFVDLVRFRLRRASSLLVWENPKPRFYGLSLALGAVLGLLVGFRLLVLGHTPDRLFGETMMLVYYGYAVPMSTRITRGFYRDGVWSDRGFMSWGQIAAVSWREKSGVTLFLVPRVRQIARRLDVPGPLYGEARRLLQDKIKAHDIHMKGAGLDLGSRDEADVV
ncbi:MAG: hypothetical protein O2930_11855 [Acidobacteria bacterium]|nr:hypothetical protein [Acidobacteriota bacterium]